MAKVMIIDDDKEFLDEVTEILEANGYVALPICEGKTAVESAEKTRPDIILLDLKLGKESGFNIARGLKRLPETRNVPIIGITGYYTEDEYNELMRVCGISKQLVKPITPEDIIKTIKEMLE